MVYQLNQHVRRTLKLLQMQPTKERVGLEMSLNIKIKMWFQLLIYFVLHAIDFFFDQLFSIVAMVFDIFYLLSQKLKFQRILLLTIYFSFFFGAVYCESCFVIPKEEILRCQVCKSLQPNGFPNVCLILDHFLEEQFPDKYSERQEALLEQHNCQYPTLIIVYYVLSFILTINYLGCFFHI